MTAPEPERRGPILPSVLVVIMAAYLGAVLALNSDNPSMFHRFATSVGVGCALAVLGYLGRAPK